MAVWTCPKCKRKFGKAKTRHTCAPGLTLEDFFATAKPWEQPVFEVVNAHLASLPENDDLIVDPIDVGIMFKHGPMICMLRSMTKWTALGFSLRRELKSSKLSRKVTGYQGKFYHVINVNDPEQIDDEVLEWLAEAFYAPVGGAPMGSDPMVPDDIDDEFDL